MTKRQGGCLCGAVRYEITGDIAVTAVCHCTHCQKQSGGIFSVNLVVPEAGYTQTGETKLFQDKGDSGHPVYRHFCGACGSPIRSTIAGMPGVVMIKAGTLDDMSGITPGIEVYTDHAVEWIAPLPGAGRFPQAAG